MSQSSEPSQVKIHFRPLQESDYDEVKALHEELFPVKYSTEFYDNVVRNKTINGFPLLSRVATVKGFDEESCPCRNYPLDELAHFVEIQAFQDNHVAHYLSISNGGNIKIDHVIGCIVGCFLDSSEKTKDEIPRSLIRDQTHKRLFYIMTLGATEEYRKQRLGTKLVEDCLNMVKQVPTCGGVYLHVITYNTAAINFYEKLGFYRIEEIKDFYSIDGVKYDCYLYAYFINGNRPRLYDVLKSAYRMVWKLMFSS